jgi:hypothetical protein
MATRASRSRTSLTAADIAAASRAYPILGFVISWYARGVQIDYGDLETLLELAGFSAYIPSKPTKRNALRRGIENWLKARGAIRGGADSVSTEDDEDGAETSSRGGRANVQQRVLVRVSSPGSSDYAVFGVVTEEVDMASLGFSHDTNLRFLLHKKSGMVIPTTDRSGVDQVTQNDQILAEIQPHWDQAKRTIVGKDISRMLVEIVQSLDPVDMGTKGGCYFVLADQEDAVNRLARLIAALPTTSRYKPFMTVLGVPDEAQWRKQLVKATKVKLDADLHAMQLDLQRFIEARPGTVKAETIAARLVEYRQLKERAMTYRDLLGLWTQDIEQGVAELQAAAAAVLTSDALAATTMGAAAPAETAAAEAIGAAVPVETVAVAA